MMETGILNALRQLVDRYVPDRVLYLWNHLDAKLKSTVLSAAAAWAFTRYGIGADSELAIAITGIIASASGYKVKNDASVARLHSAEDAPEDGNAIAPDDVQPILDPPKEFFQLAEEGEPEVPELTGEEGRPLVQPQRE